MAKKGMSRPDEVHHRPQNEVPPVPEISGKAKHGKGSVNPIIAGTESPAQKVYHSRPHEEDAPIPADIYPAIDNDLARDNLENDLTAADRQDLT